VKSVKSLKAKAWKLFSEYIRRSYADRNGYVSCYTCGTKAHWKQLQAGHAIGGRRNAVLFDEELVRPQCVACNVFLRGNYPVYVAKLIGENGLEWFNRKLAGSRKAVKISKPDLQELIAKYQGALGELRSN